VHQLFIDFKKAYDLVRREVLHNILIEFGIHRKLVRLIKMCLMETYSRVWVGKNLSDESKFYSGRSLEQTEVRECLLSFSAESFVFQFAIQKFKD
jgi:hypothetical protein